MRPIPTENQIGLSVVERSCQESADAPARPVWLTELFEGCTEEFVSDSPAGIHLTIQDAPHRRLVRARVIGAAALEDAAFRAATIAAYAQIVRQLQAGPVCHAARIWNYIPDIHRRCGNGMDRYMVFNSGRFEACRQWLGTGLRDDQFQSRLPTASGVGHGGSDLIIDALGMDLPGVAIENPRQIAAYQYSPRFGPRPPCFARGTKIAGLPGEPDRLFVGGTASVRGELSVHEADLGEQIEETLENLTTLVRAARGYSQNGSKPACELGSFCELRVYHPRPDDEAAIMRVVRRRFGPATRVERVIAELCRKELLVEIEGVVMLKSRE